MPIVTRFVITVKYAIVTFGCRVNQADSLRIEEDLGDTASYPGRDTFYNLR